MQVGKPAQWRRWGHEIVYLAAVETNFFDLKTLKDGDANFKQIKDRFTEIYESYVDRVLAGETFSIPESHRIEQKPIDYTSPRHKRAGEKSLESLKFLFDD